MRRQIILAITGALILALPGLAPAADPPAAQTQTPLEQTQTPESQTPPPVAEPEKVMHVECANAAELAKAAYHLGNRHVPVQVGEGFLRLAADHVLEEMLKKLGAAVSQMEAPFEPEAGAYAGGHHQHDEMGHGGKIHEHHHDHEHGHK